ncbi:MAG: hypothetical protein R3B72_07255 [Polyangiaceae bacterium]
MALAHDDHIVTVGFFHGEADFGFGPEKATSAQHAFILERPLP